VTLRGLAAVALLAGTAWAQEATDAAAPSGGDRLLLDEVQRIAKRVETLRRETFVRPPFAVRVPEDMRRVAAEIRAFANLSRDAVAARGRAWEDIGLGDARSPRSLLLALAGDLGGIGFDPQGNRLLVTPSRLRPEDFEPTGDERDGATFLLLTGMRPDEPVVAHLLTHVRQRERRGGDWLAGTTDRLLAASAWAEGEANLVAVAYLFSGMNVGRDVLEFLKTPAEVLDGALLPPGLERLGRVERQLLEFVYIEGFERAAGPLREGGWAALDRAVAERRTTRDVLHPDRPPIVPAALGASARPPRPGLRLVDRDTLGERAIAVLLASLTGKDSLGLAASEGWAGDRLDRWEPPGDAAGGITEWVTRWRARGGDPPRPASRVAADFASAYVRALESRFPGRKAAPAGEHALELVAGDRSFRIELRAASGTDEAEVRVGVRPRSRSAGAETADPGEGGDPAGPEVPR
jgi:hypothetical protein